MRLGSTMQEEELLRTLLAVGDDAGFAREGFAAIMRIYENGMYSFDC